MRTSVPLGLPHDSRLRVAWWHEVLVLEDSGDARPSDYMVVAREAGTVARDYPDGIGCLTIVPPSAKPPTEEVRRAIHESYLHVAKSLRCVCWLVQGTEFRAATARAVVAGIRFLMRAPFPTMVAGTMEEALPWLLENLPARRDPSHTAARAIADIRRELAHR